MHRKFRFRFGLKWSAIALAICAGLFGRVAYEIRLVQAQAHAASQLKRAGVTLVVADQPSNAQSEPRLLLPTPILSWFVPEHPGFVVTITFNSKAAPLCDKWPDFSSLRWLRRVNWNSRTHADACFHRVRQTPWLRAVSLDYSDLTDEGGVAIKDLVDLEQFSAEYSQVGDNTLLSLSGNSKLIDLRLAGTRVTDNAVRSCIGNDTSMLSLLDLSFTAVTDRAIDALMRADNLQHVFLEGTSVTDLGVERLAKKDNLATLDLSDTSITDAGLSHLGNHLQLRTLRVRRCNVSDVSVPAICRINLEEFDCSYTLLTSRGTQVICTKLSNLRDLRMCGNKVNIDACIALAQLQHLTYLDVSATDCNDECVEALAESRSLVSINASGSSITPRCLSAFARCGSLRHLTISSAATNPVEMNDIKNSRPDLSISIME